MRCFFSLCLKIVKLLSKSLKGGADGFRPGSFPGMLIFEVAKSGCQRLSVGLEPGQVGPAFFCVGQGFVMPSFQRRDPLLDRSGMADGIEEPCPLLVVFSFDGPVVLFYRLEVALQGFHLLFETGDVPGDSFQFAAVLFALSEKLRGFAVHLLDAVVEHVEGGRDVLLSPGICLDLALREQLSGARIVQPTPCFVHLPADDRKLGAGRLDHPGILLKLSFEDLFLLLEHRGFSIELLFPVHDFFDLGRPEQFRELIDLRTQCLISSRLVRL
ncbi:MAG: hypothetical protein BWZ01_02664 [Deltaproteobacteria bacterium ADurb.BinA179]|nr:MAG: hypothetical protein BWZ01_02664 [Deltaproteobacteria bacterium ADurb.BinA179]